MPDLSIKCECGSLTGVVRGVSPKMGTRVICYCDDCQLFLHHLGCPERLDRHGGTDIFQVSPARVDFTDGIEHLACVRLRPNGLLRWYASCCRSPIGNTLATGQVPFVGLLLSSAKETSDGSNIDAAIGASVGVHGKFAKTPTPELDAHDRAPVTFLLRWIRMVLSARLRGDHRRSPFFDSSTGQPVVKPAVLSSSELSLAEAARDG